MPKVFLKIVLLIVMALPLQGQRKDYFYLTIEPGLSIPAGQYAQKDFDMPAPRQKVNGLARPGYQFALSAGYRFNKSVGVVLMAAYSSNKRDENLFEEYALFTLAPGSTASASSDRWHIYRLMTGLSMRGTISADKKLFIEGKMMVGLCKTKEPGYEISTTTPGNPLPSFTYLKVEDQKLPASFCWQANTAVGYLLNEQLYLLFDLGYFDSKPIYKFSAIPFPGPGPAVQGRREFRLSSIGLSLGLGVKL
jgi:hypothetical protein